MSNEQQQQAPNVYKTSKTTWFLIGLMVVILGIIIWMMTRKKKEGAEGATAEAGASVASAPAPAS